MTNTKNLGDIRFIVATTHVNINFREALYGYTPLLMAVEAGWIEAVMYFLSVDADIHAKLSDGRGVLELVSDNDVKILLERHIQAQDND